MINLAYKKLKICIGSGIISSLFVIAVTLIFPDLFREMELKIYDYMMRARGEIETDTGIILIDIDDRSLDSIGRWPWDRSIHARMIDILGKNKVKTIAYDILFNHPSDKRSDNLLVKTTKDSGRIYYPVGFELIPPDMAGIRSNADTSLEELRQYGFGKFMGNTKGILTVERAIAPMNEISISSKGLGHISSNRDKDGIIRRVPLIVKMDGILFPSFGLSVVMDYLDVSNEDIIIRPGRSLILKGALFHGEKRRRDIVIPIDDKGMMLINYAGIWTRTFKHYSFRKIIETYDDIESEHGMPDMEEVIVIVSNSASGYDIKPVPIENSHPGGGIHANIINTILTENFLSETSTYLKIMIIMLFGIIAGLCGIIIRWQLKVIYIILTLSLFTIFSYYLFISSGMVLDIISPTIAGILGSVIVAFYQTQSEKKKASILSEEKERLKKELEIVNNRLLKKENEIKVEQEELSNRANSVSNVQLKEKYLADRIEKEDLEKKSSRSFGGCLHLRLKI